MQFLHAHMIYLEKMIFFVFFYFFVPSVFLKLLFISRKVDKWQISVYKRLPLDQCLFLLLFKIFKFFCYVFFFFKFFCYFFVAFYKLCVTFFSKISLKSIINKYIILFQLKDSRSKTFDYSLETFLNVFKRVQAIGRSFVWKIWSVMICTSGKQRRRSKK